MHMFCGNFLILMLPVLSTAASCGSNVDSCFLESDETSLIQTKKSVELGSERPVQGAAVKESFNPMTNALNMAANALTNGLNQAIPSVGGPQVAPTGDAIIDSYRGLPVLSSHAKCKATVDLAEKALAVPGDFVECGTYYGGTSVMMAKVLQRDSTRQLWAADSFAGLPTGTTQDQGHGNAGDYTASRQEFENNLEANGLGNSQTNPQIQVLQGWFSETLPTAPIQQISFLRLDGDAYVSYHDSLNSLYDKVAPGGYVYIDDYGLYPGCKQAVDEFRQQRGITEPMNPVSESIMSIEPGNFDAVWWQKAG